jgi:hypothetical protein
MESHKDPKGGVIRFRREHVRKFIASDHCQVPRLDPRRLPERPVHWHDFPEDVLRRLRELHGPEWWRW